MIKIKELTLNDFDDTDALINMALETLCGIKKYYITDVLSCDDIFTTNCRSYIMRTDYGDLSISYNREIWVDKRVNEEDAFSTYYKVSELNELLRKINYINKN